MVKEIEISRILPHPENINRMDAQTLSKLRRHIESTGRYEPLIVRPHPREEGKFEVINGHHRLEVLKALGRDMAKCLIWEVNDVEARLYLATLNRLSGEDVPERRAVLISRLLESFDRNVLVSLLPDRQQHIAELERIAKLDLAELVPRPTAAVAGGSTVVLEFFVDAEGARQVGTALDAIAHRDAQLNGRSAALVRLACCYLSAEGIQPGGGDKQVPAAGEQTKDLVPDSTR